MWLIICITLLAQVREQPPIFPPEGWEVINHPNFRPIKIIPYTRWYVYGESPWEREQWLNAPLPALQVPYPPVPYLPGANYVPPDVANPQPIKRPLQNLRTPFKGLLNGRQR